jgi:hypothetical protein
MSTNRLDFPHAAQAIRVTGRVRDQKTKKWRTVTVYAITNLTAAQVSPAELADYGRAVPDPRPAVDVPTVDAAAADVWLGGTVPEWRLIA